MTLQQLDAPTVYSLLRQRFGGDTETEDTTAIVQATNADAIFLRLDPRRVAFTFANLSANPIFIRPMGVASAAVGITCPAGTLTSVAYPDDLHLASLEWHFVAPAGNSACYLVALRFSEAPGTVPIGSGSF